MNRSRRTTLRNPQVAILATLAVALAGCGTASPAATESPGAEPPAVVASASPASEQTAEPASETASPPPAEQATEEVRIVSSNYTPDTLTIPVGTQVVFVNEDSFAHTVTEGTDGQAADGAFVDATVVANEEVTVTFDESGTFPITCRFHPAMQMEIVVEG